MPLRGRGAKYSKARGVVEWTLATAYRRDWPARVVRTLGMQRRIQVRHHRIAAPRWPAGARPLRIAFASDLHAGPTTHGTVLDDAFAALASIRADVLLLGGDYVPHRGSDLRDHVAARAVAAATARRVRGDGQPRSVGR